MWGGPVVCYIYNSVVWEKGTVQVEALFLLCNCADLFRWMWAISGMSHMLLQSWTNSAENNIFQEVPVFLQW